MRINWQKTASVLFCVLVMLGALFLVGKYILVIVMPFLIAWGLAFSLRPAAKRLAARTGIPLRVCSVLLLTFLLCVLGILLFFGLNRLMEELGRLAEGVSSENSAIGQKISSILNTVEQLSDRIPFLADSSEPLRKRFDQMLTTVLQDAAGKIMAGITSLATELIRSVPSFALFIIVTIIAAFYFALDLDTFHRSITALLPHRLSEKLPEYGARTRRFAAKYLRAYLLLMFLTFCELFVGFTVLSVEYSLLLALIISVVDVLPVLGVGTVLVPWSVIELLSRDFKTGFGLLILWAAITVIRQIIEPKIVGGSLGLHPLVTLVGMYVGFRLFGIVGMLAAPALAVAAKVILKEWRPQKKSA